jgi:hypothetical protein
MKGQTDNTGTSAVFSSPAQILSLYVQGMIAGLIGAARRPKAKKESQ